MAVRKPQALLLSVACISLLGASCGGASAAEKAAKAARNSTKAIREAEDAGAAARAAERPLPRVEDEEVMRLQEVLKDAVETALCEGTEIIADAVEAGEPAAFDWSDWAPDRLRPSLATDFSDDDISSVGGELAFVLDALEGNTELLKGVADACGLATSL